MLKALSLSLLRLPLLLSSSGVRPSSYHTTQLLLAPPARTGWLVLQKESCCQIYASTTPYLASFSSGAKRGLLLLYEVYPTGRGVKLLVKLVKNRMFS